MKHNIAEEKAIEQMGDAEELGKKLNKIHKPKLDWKLLILISILIIYGVIVAVCKQNDSNSIVKDTIFYMVTGLIAGLFVYFVDYKKIKNYSNLIYLIADLIVLLPALGIFKSVINGVNYFYIAGTSFNTATIAVPLFVISFVGFLNNINKNNVININLKMIGKNIIIHKDIVKIIILGIFSLLLISTIPSMSNGMILGISYLVTASIYIAKKNKNGKKILIRMYATITVLGILMIVLIAINYSYILQRLMASSFKPELSPQGEGYFGMIQKDIMENSKLIGEADTEIIKSDEYAVLTNSNFTFIYLIGKAGIIVASILIITIILTSIKLLINSKTIKDMYGKLLIIGLAILYILQSIMSVLMNINLGIKFNINLPFVSSGGMYFVMNAISIALILSIYRKKDINIEVKELK